jgi:hypothetical protein
MPAIDSYHQRRLFIVIPIVVLVFIGVCHVAGHADVGQGGHITRTTADVIHGVTELELMSTQLKYKLDYYKSEKSKCDLVLQESQKALCEDVLRALNSELQDLHRTFNATANGIESEIATVKRKADPEHLEILDRMLKKMSQTRQEVNRQMRAVLNAG